MSAVNADSRDSRMESDDIRSIIARIEGIGLLVLDPADEVLVERIARALAKRFHNQTIDTAAMPENWKRWRDLSDEIQAREVFLKSNLARFILASLAPNLPGDPVADVHSEPDPS